MKLLGRLKYLTILLIAASASAQEPVRPIASCWSVEVGAAHLADTYLSAMKYDGMHMGVEYSRRQAMSTMPCTQGWNLGVSFDRAKNPARNATMLGARIEGAWQMLRRWELPDGFQVALGGYCGAEIGALYVARNGNNPVQAQAAANVGPEVYGQWRRGRHTLRITAAAPLTGAFFCPDYGELYYEIALGNRQGLMHCAWPGNYRQLRAMADYEICLGHTTLRLGYKFHGTSSRANGITSRRLEHSAVVGIVTEFITINTQRHAPIVRAY